MKREHNTDGRFAVIHGQRNTPEFIGVSQSTIYYILHGHIWAEEPSDESKRTL